MKLFKKRKQLCLEAAALGESTAYLNNPSRGWYQIYSFAIEKRPDFEELYWCLGKEETIALVIFDIGAFRGSALSGEALSNAEEILQFFGQHEKEVILRITYDREGHGMEREPDFLKTVTGHMQQLGRIIRTCREQVLLVQGMLIGSWGEMHDSKFLSEERIRQLMKAWREALTEEIPVAVRTPQQWRLLHKEGTAAGEDMTGLFDDGIFGSADNLGTYGQEKKETAGWQERWSKEDELDFVGSIGACIPYGGEAVGQRDLPLFDMAEELRRTNACYLNRIHDAARLNQWKASVWQESGVWNGVNGFDYIGCHLGYRFVVRQAELTGKKEPCLRLVIENTGFSNAKDELELVFCMDSEDGGKKNIVLPGDLHHINSKETKEILLPLPVLEEGISYDLSLRMRRMRDGWPVFFANTPAGEAVRIGSLSCR